MKKCKNGHYYIDELSECPYCPKTEGYSSADEGETVLSSDDSNDKTKIFGDEDENSNDKTRIFGDDDVPKDITSNDKTKIFGGEKTVEDKPIINKMKENSPRDWNKTYIGGDLGDEDENAEVEAPRLKRMLVGWVVSFTIDKMGADFRLYEGKNIIGSAPDCEITVTGDKVVSSKHATILFRNNKFRIKDEFSTNGTYVNDKDIEDETVLLMDGDTIKIGATIFKFRTAL